MKKILLLSILLISIGCTANNVVKSHGSKALESKSKKIEIQKTNKNDVLSLMGKPSSVSLFDKNLWFYLEREKITQSVFKLGKTKIVKNNILEISFDNKGLVKSMKMHQIDKMNDLKIEQARTNKTYSDTSYISKVLNSIKQKANTSKQNRKKTN